MNSSSEPKVVLSKLYGRRKGRPLSIDLQKSFNNDLPRLGIDRAQIAAAAEQSLHPRDFFGQSAAYWLEIGFGAGDFLAGQAAMHPEIGMIGCEAFENGIAKLLYKITQNNINNIRIYNDDARQLLAKLQDHCLDRAFLLFPDPWPKKRHEKRRFVNPDNIRELARVLKPKAELWIATDDPTYQQWVLTQMSAQSLFIAHDPKILNVTPPHGWVETNYQKKADRAGRIPAYALFSKA